MLRWILLIFALCLKTSLSWAEYEFIKEPIDVVIPCSSKDIDTLDLCIQGVKENCHDVRRIIVVSETRLTDKAEWFSEKSYPFNKKQVALHLLKKDKKKAKDYIAEPGSRLGWYYQQLLKFYAPLVIPGISSNVLIVDSDVIFMKPVKFLNSHHAGLYATCGDYNHGYLQHAARLVPGLKRVHKDHSGIVDHMLFQRPVIEDLFRRVEKHHRNEFYQAFCECVKTDFLKGSGASEYEIYFNFAFTQSKKVEVRFLMFTHSGFLEKIPEFKAKGFDFITFHRWLRDLEQERKDEG